MARRRFQERRRSSVYPEEGPLARRPKCAALHVESWFHLERAHVAVYDEDNKLLASWWDHEVHEAFDRGYFVEGPGFERSVLERLAAVNFCSRAGLGRR